MEKRAIQYKKTKPKAELYCPAQVKYVSASFCIEKCGLYSRFQLGHITCRWTEADGAMDEEALKDCRITGSLRRDVARHRTKKE